MGVRLLCAEAIGSFCRSSSALLSPGGRARKMTNNQFGGYSPFMPLFVLQKAMEKSEVTCK